jgi:hypothetical protein
VIWHTSDETLDFKCIFIRPYLMNEIFIFAYLIRSCPKGSCIDLVLKYFVAFIYLNLPRLVVVRFEIFASVF